MTRPEQFRHWFTYEIDAHAKTVDSLRALPASEGQQRAVDLLAHLVAARRLWLHRMGRAQTGPAEVFPRAVALRAVEAELETMQNAWLPYLESLDTAELEREFSYRSLEGDSYRNRVDDILTQLFGHSWYHRGQIAALVRAAGGQPAETDYVYWTRQAIDV